MFHIFESGSKGDILSVFVASIKSMLCNFLFPFLVILSNMKSKIRLKRRIIRAIIDRHHETSYKIWKIVYKFLLGFVKIYGELVGLNW